MSDNQPGNFPSDGFQSVVEHQKALDKLDEEREAHQKALQQACVAIAQTPEGEILRRYLKNHALARSFVPGWNQNFETTSPQEVAYAEGMRMVALEILEMMKTEV